MSTTCLGRKSSDSTYFLLWNTRIPPWTSRVWGGITWVYGSDHQNNKASESFLKSVMCHLWFKHSTKRKGDIRYKNVRMSGVLFYSFYVYTARQEKLKFACAKAETSEWFKCIFSTIFACRRPLLCPMEGVKKGAAPRSSEADLLWQFKHVAV